MEDSVDELSRSHDRLFPPSSPTKQFTIPDGLGSSPSKKRNDTEQSSPSQQRQSFLIDTPAPVRNGTSRSTVSPMRIRVTVEAEPSGITTPLTNAGMDKQNGTALDFDMGTTTITIPLKNENEHKPAKRRGRPRKSLDATSTPIAKGTEQDQSSNKPKGTPKPRKHTASTPAQTKQTRASGKKDNNAANVTEFPDLDTPSARIEISDEPIAKRTRRSSAVGITTTPTEAPPSSKKPRKRMDFSALTPLHQKKNAGAAKDAATAETMTFTPWGARKAKEESAAKKIRERVPTPRKSRPLQKVTFSSPLQEDTGKHTEVSAAEQRKLDQNYAELDQEGDEDEGEEDESEVVGIEDDDIEEDVEMGEEGFGDDVDDGMTGLEDDTSVLDRSAVESEGFSMVSIDSLRNHRRVAETEKVMKQPQSKLSFEQRISEEPEEAERRVSGHQIRRSPARSESQKTTRTEPDKHDENIFGAFGAGTRRQLQARLAMGRMLAGDQEETANAETQHPSSMQSKGSHGNQDAYKQHSRPHRLPTPAEEEQYHKETSPKRAKVQQHPFSIFAGRPSSQQASQQQNNIFHAPITPSTSGHDESFELSQTQLFQQEVQREREQVVRQAAMANTSQIVILDDTTMNDAEEDDEGQACFDETMNSQEKSQVQEDSGVGVVDAAEDMWLDEADRSMESSLIPRPARRSLKRKAEQNDHVERQESPPGRLEDLFPLDTRPPRAKLPRTWRRTSGADFLYSDELASPAHLLTKAKQTQPQIFASVPEDTADVWLDTQVRQNGGGRAARARNVQPVASSRSPVHTTSSLGVRKSPRRKAAPVVAPEDAMINKQYFSESEQQHEPFEDQDEVQDVDMSFSAADRHSESQNENTIHQSIETDTLADTSDARQLQRELLATTRAHKRQARSRLHTQQTANDQRGVHRERSKPLLRQPGKVYEPLFGAATQTQKRQSSIHQAPAEQTDSSLVNKATGAITPFNNTNIEDKPSMLNRLTSWLFRIPPADPHSFKTNPSRPQPQTTISTSTSTTTSTHPPPLTNATQPPASSSTPQSPILTWNRNHYLLLDHHYTRVLHSTTKPLPPAYMTPWTNIPSSLRKLVGTKLMTTTAIGTGPETKDTHPATISEQWVRIAYCFVAEAKERGVPVLCDGLFVPVREAQNVKSVDSHMHVDVNVEMDDGLAVGAEWQAKGGQGYPVRDEMTGRVKRVKQEWWGTEEGAWDVLGRVYSLWVRDEVMGMGAEGVR